MTQTHVDMVWFIDCSICIYSMHIDKVRRYDSLLEKDCNANPSVEHGR